MIFESDMLLCFTLGGIIYADSEAAWQLMISQPLISCTLAGLILGNAGLGITAGLILQLPYLAEIPVGGSNISLSSLGCFIAAMLAITSSRSYPGYPVSTLVLAVAFGVAIAWLGTPMRGWQRTINRALSNRLEQACENSNTRRVVMLNYAGVVSAIAFGLAFTALFFTFGEIMMTAIVPRISLDAERSLRFIQPLLFGAGFGVVLRIFVRKKTIWYTAAGFGLTLATIFALSR